MLEMTVLLPLFLVIWFGIIDWGIAFWVHETVVFNTNQAVRWAVVNDYDPAKIRAAVLYGDPNSTKTDRPWWDLSGNVNVEVSNPDAGDPVNQRITITVSNYQWFHFTPFFAGTYAAQPITVSLPAEDMRTGL
ncbi:MAG: TadE/TadG family type IV pilus assembly protein [bacterium]|jgi:hypothetical protein